MVHSESSILDSLRGGSEFSKEEPATSVSSGNGRYTDPLGRRKSKRFKVAAESELSPDCGTVSMRLRSRTVQKEDVLIDTRENNRNVSDNDFAPCSEAEVELIPGENVVGQDRLKSVDVTENTSDLGMVEVHAPSISLQEDVVPLELEKLKVTVPKPVEAAGRTRTHIIGAVSGVEVGDGFQYRMDLNPIGLHRPSQSGIDYMKDYDGELVAMSIVSSGGYGDVLDNSDVLIYTGQGGNLGKKNKNNEPKDQELVKGNLALKNSIHKKNPVRVIRGYKNTTLKSSPAAKNYVYDGLYLVEEYWDETGSHGKRVFKFKLRRIPGQPELSWKVVEKTKKTELRQVLCSVDISGGEETLPIRAVNDIDDEKPPPFIYTAEMIYPDWCKPLPARTCGCTKRCSESKTCSCVARNGGEIPYNNDGAILEVKPLVYECGPHCKCPPSCYMRVTQHGIKIKLELFKTESRGWGVRSLETIPVGSFVCEYAGELLEDKQAEILTGKDEYLFNLGEEEDPFTIDAGRKGNIGRFINHSCSPNMYAQDVLYEYDETRIPHVMFFAQEVIRPLEELTYDYNYKIDQVRDSNGNIKKKFCYCGSAECSGRLY
ncbi:PREDICTED: histone-lysine N-methyltransferase, H3 lysine-9 specific SUVH5-like [Camelina sativa]|uniref:Histone-lysine N-methyltransferase, H3 lysine-9 specific SUVH5-like n=1 Tax=Camelina sativa TaxID=90675 RepID=A0ABM0Z2V2_CAMSA|nr:PREDICTED: histone-lysine N-methyltransferase, H3 lysine-9 specific SUVH5-like [Camelina sativa]